MTGIGFILIAYLSGSLPFSVWLGKIFLGKDVRQYGDGNPGSTNVFRAGSKVVGVIALLLDISKAAVPVGLAYNNLEIRGFPMFLVAIAPILGHMYSPFLGFHGGKAVATLLGVWIGLTLWKASLPAVIFAVIGIWLFRVPGWAVMTGLVGIFLALVIWMPDPLLLSILAAHTILMVWTHREDLRTLPHLPFGSGFNLRRAKN